MHSCKKYFYTSVQQLLSLREQTIKDRSGQVHILKCKKCSLTAFYLLLVLFVAGIVTYQSLHWLISRLCHTFLSCISSHLKVKKLGYEYFIDANAPAQCLTHYCPCRTHFCSCLSARNRICHVSGLVCLFFSINWPVCIVCKVFLNKNIVYFYEKIRYSNIQLFFWLL